MPSNFKVRMVSDHSIESPHGFLLNQTLRTRPNNATAILKDSELFVLQVFLQAADGPRY